ncbi:MAG: SDR family oxidoreductase [Pseudomonadota bacterium]
MAHPTDPRPVADQGVVLFGGSSGIGLAAAHAFTRSGARCVLIGRASDRGARAAAAVAGDTRFIAADCSLPEQASAAVDKAVMHLGRIDTCLCTMGGNRLPELLFRQSLEEIAATVRLDLVPMLLATRATLAAMMEAGGGTILSVASDAGKLATPGEAVIGANMAAIIQFTRTLALEGKRNGVRANVITPSLVEGTPLTDRLMEEGRFSAKLFAKARPKADLGATTPEDLAELAVFLASPAAARITGQAISVNGGISAA